MPLHLHIMCGCFQTTATELSSCDSDHMAYKALNTCYLVFQRKDDFPNSTAGKEPACNAGAAEDVDSIPGLGISPGQGNGKPLQDSCLKNPMDKEARQVTVQTVAKSWTQLNPSTYLTEKHLPFLV